MKNTSVRASMIAGLAGLALGASALGQMATPPSREVAWPADSGLVQPPKGAPGPQVVYSTTVLVPHSGWLRLAFGAVELSGRVEEGQGAYLVITSLADGAEQYLNATSAAQWSSTSAYFNGDAVRVDLVAFPGQGPSRVAIRSVTAGLPAGAGGPDSLCGPDDRILSFDNRTARHSTGCTSWLISDTNRQFLTAGHCGTVATSVMSFNVPLSTGSGQTVQSAPQDQYPVDGTSIQSNGGGGIGNDFCYFGVFPNSNTGLMPLQAYNAGFFTVQLPPPVGAGQIVRITGYGTTSSPISPTWSQVQKTHSGPRVTPVTGVIATTVSYQTDTTGGNSGSPVILESAPPNGTIAIGIHTHAGCSASAGNNGTGLNHAGVQNALNNPTGACRTGRGTPAGPLYAAGDSVNNFGTLSMTGGGFARVDAGPPRMEGLAYNRNTGLFFGVSNETINNPPGQRRLWTINPATGAATFVANISGVTGVVNGLGYDPQSNVLHGVIQATGTLIAINTTTGVANVNSVANGGAIGALEWDPLTQALYGIDDNAGVSRLVRFTPATGASILVGNLGPGIADCNGLAVTDDGTLWTINAATDQLLRINPATGAATVVGPTLGLFGASFGMAAVLAGAPCYANCDNSTSAPILNVNDFICFQSRFAAGEPYADCDSSGVLNVNDFVCFQSRFAAGCR